MYQTAGTREQRSKRITSEPRRLVGNRERDAHIARAALRRAELNRGKILHTRRRHSTHQKSHKMLPPPLGMHHP